MKNPIKLAYQGNNIGIKTITALVISMIFMRGNAQDMHLAGDTYLGPVIEEEHSPKLKVAMKSGTASGMLIENEFGKAHTWLPYTDGTIYLTGDRTNGKKGDFIFRRYTGTSYINELTLRSIDGQIISHTLIPDVPDSGTAAMSISSSGAVSIKKNEEKIGINAYGFISDDPHFVVQNGKATILNNASSGRIYAPVQLPNGVRITKMEAFLIDDTPNNAIICNLYTNLHNTPATGVLGNVKSGYAATPGDFEDDDEINHLVDNNKRSYYIAVHPEDLTWPGGGGGNSIYIRSVVITYKYP